MNEIEARSQFTNHDEVPSEKFMTEQEALAQFIKPDKTMCGKCFKKLVSKTGLYPDRYFDCDANNNSIEVCHSCFDDDIKKRQGFYN